MSGDDGPCRGDRVGLYRPHAAATRHHQVKLRYNDDEYRAVEAAARAARLTISGYAADAALAAATGADPPAAEPWREALLELIKARHQVRRIGINLNQATRILNATSETPKWLEHAARAACVAVERLDRTTIELSINSRTAS